MADQALAAAEQADQELDEKKYRGPLHGVPTVSYTHLTLPTKA